MSDHALTAIGVLGAMAVALFMIGVLALVAGELYGNWRNTAMGGKHGDTDRQAETSGAGGHGAAPGGDGAAVPSGGQEQPRTSAPATADDPRITRPAPNPVTRPTPNKRQRGH